LRFPYSDSTEWNEALQQQIKRNPPLMRRIIWCWEGCIRQSEGRGGEEEVASNNATRKDLEIRLSTMSADSSALATLRWCAGSPLFVCLSIIWWRESCKCYLSESMREGRVKFEGPITRPERGSEWESIKILLQRENSAYVPNSQPRIATRVCQGSVVTADLPTLGANPK
jgi:hypothetical protein